MSGPFDFRPQGAAPRAPATGQRHPGPDEGWGRGAVRARAAVPPGRWLAAAALAALVGALLGAWSVFGATGGLPVASGFAGWVVAGPVAIGLLAVHSVGLTRARAASPVDVRSGTTVAVRRAVLLVAAVGIALAAWRIADWAGRL